MIVDFENCSQIQLKRSTESYREDINSLSQNSWKLTYSKKETSGSEKILVYRLITDNTGRDSTVAGDGWNTVKGTTSIRGVTARELCRLYWSPADKPEWDSTIDRVKLLLGSTTDMKFVHTVYKRVWPVKVRDTVTVCHMYSLNESTADETGSHADVPLENGIYKERPSSSRYVVVHKSCDHPDAEILPRTVRAQMFMLLFCETVYQYDSNGACIKDDRDAITTKFTFISEVRPGGDVPASIIKPIYKREFAKFMNDFPKYAVAQTIKQEDILW